MARRKHEHGEHASGDDHPSDRPVPEHSGQTHGPHDHDGEDAAAHAPHASRATSQASQEAHSHDHPHAHGAAEGHDHDLRAVPESKLQIAFIVTVLFMAVEFVFGLYTRSLTLTSDAGHMLADAGALLLALIAQRFARRVPTPRATYGFRRAETLAAFLNGLALTITAALIVHEAWARWWHPVLIRGRWVVLVAVIGLCANLFVAWILARGHTHNLNTRAALAHVGFDAVGSLAAIAAGVTSWTLGWTRVDPALSFAMAGLIVVGAWLILKRVVAILMEGTPVGLDVRALERTIRETPGVAEIHDLHAWTISDGFDSVTVHVVLDSGHHGVDVARRVGERIRASHRVGHVTVQPEAPEGPKLRPASSLLQRPN